MKYSRMVWFWVTDFGWPDVSFGIHICLHGRVDIHFLKWMFSFGEVPIYKDSLGVEIAVANSYHFTQKGRLRAGVP